MLSTTNKLHDALSEILETPGALKDRALRKRALAAIAEAQKDEVKALNREGRMYGSGGRYPTNGDRADWAEEALRTFGQLTRQDEHIGSGEKALIEEIVGDFLADLMHYCCREGVSFDALLENGRMHHDEEVEEGNDE